MTVSFYYAETASPTVPVVKSSNTDSQSSASTLDGNNDEGPIASGPSLSVNKTTSVDDQPDSPSVETKSKKRNRCTSCKKKVGLTGSLLVTVCELVFIFHIISILLYSLVKSTAID